MPLTETLAAFQALQQAGKIRAYGVSNFDTQDMAAASHLKGGDAIATNQVLYNLARRGVEWDLLPWCRQHKLPLMAYAPIEQGRLLHDRTLTTIAQALGVTAAQVAIAWLWHQDNVIVISKASRIEHVEQNYAALDLKLGVDELDALDAAFPAPAQAVPLEML